MEELSKRRVFEGFTNQKQWESFLKKVVKKDDEFLKRSIIVVYKNQTQEEAEKGKSLEDNAVGFGRIDAEIMSKVAEKILHSIPLTEKEIAISRNKMGKYWKQLMVHAKEVNGIKKNVRKLSEYEEFAKQNNLKLGELFFIGYPGDNIDWLEPDVKMVFKLTKNCLMKKEFWTESKFEKDDDTFKSLSEFVGKALCIFKVNTDICSECKGELHKKNVRKLDGEKIEASECNKCGNIFI